MALTYRPLATRDRDFCVLVHHLAMRAYVEPLWGWDEAQQDRLALEFLDHRDATHEVVLADSLPIGYLSYQHGHDRLILNKLHLHPEHHNKGFGSEILLRMIRRADSAAAPIELSVLTTNLRARVFYERHGFFAVQTTAEKVRMHRVVSSLRPG